MAVIHISEADAARNFSSLLAQVAAGAEVIIEKDGQRVAVMHATTLGPLRCGRHRPPASRLRAVIDEEFPSDVEAAVVEHWESLKPPQWD